MIDKSIDKNNTMKILRACITSKTVSETKHEDDYLGHHYNLVPSIKVMGESNIEYNCLFYSYLNNLGIQEKIFFDHNNEDLNKKVQAERETLEKRLNHFFSVNDRIIVVGEIENKKFIIYVFYNKTKDKINLRKHSFIDIFWRFIMYFIIGVLMSYIIFRIPLFCAIDNLISASTLALIYSVFFLCFEFLKVRKINNLLLKAMRSDK